MIKVIHTILLSLLVAGQVNFAYAQTASILPNAKTVFLDSNGKPLVGGKVQFYVPGTTSPKTTWQDSGETIPNTNPVILDGAGRAIILGDGNYRQVVTDRLGNLIWDQATSSTGSGGGGTTATVGDGDAVGTVKPWSGLIAPNAYVFSYGQELARASFPLLFSTITTQQNVGCTSGNATLTGLGDTSQIPMGAPVESICLNAGATVVSTTISTITVSSNAIITTNSSARIFPFGNGDGSTTFNVPDLRGRAVAGRDNMGSVAANRLTSAATGFGKVAALGANGGNQSLTLVTGNLPPYTPTGIIAGTSNINKSGYNISGGGTQVYGDTGNAPTNFPLTLAGTFTGSAQGGTSVPFQTIQPTEILNYIIKTLPDTNPNSFFGVASIGGMTGILLCGTGITCTAGTISAISSTVPAPTAITLGGVFSLTCSTHNWFSSVDNTGTFGCTQPNFTDLAGSIAAGQIPNNIISNAMIRQSTALSLVGRSANSTGNVADISATAGSSCAFIESGNTLICGQLATAGIANSAVTGAKIATNTVTNSNLTQTASNTFKGNSTAATANISDFTIGGLTNKPSPSTNDILVIQDASTGNLRNSTIAQAIGSVASGVSSLNGQTGAISLGSISPQVRITLASGVPVMTTSQASQTTVYVTPYSGCLIPIYDGTTNMVPTCFAEVSQATTDTTKSPAAVAASSIYDVFCWIDSGTQRCTRGPPWTNATTRSAGTALVLVNGIWLNNASITNGPAASRGTYVGTIGSNASSSIDYIFGAGGTGGVAALFNVWNAYNRVPVKTQVFDTNVAGWSFTFSGTIGTVQYRAADASTTNRATFLRGLPLDGVSCEYQVGAQGSTTSIISYSGCALDSTTAQSGYVGFTAKNTTPAASIKGTYAGVPGLGQHFLQAIEGLDNTGTSSFTSLINSAQIGGMTVETFQ